MKKIIILQTVCLLLLTACHHNQDINSSSHDASINTKQIINEDDEPNPSPLQASVENNAVHTVEVSDIDRLFGMNYRQIKAIQSHNSSFGLSKPFKYTIEVPIISIDHSQFFYFLNGDSETKPSFIEFSNEYDIKPLIELNIQTTMTPREISKLDEDYKITQFWTGNNIDYHYYVDIHTEKYTYYLTAKTYDEPISSIYIVKNGNNDIINQYAHLKNLINHYSEYNGMPIFYQEGYINDDEYQDMIITFKMDQKNLKNDLEEDRVSLILFGNNEGFTKYGEVVGLIASYGGALGNPIVEMVIEDGQININQYGGSNWRWNTYSIYKYNPHDKRIYLSYLEDCSYHNVLPVQNTLQTTVTEYTDEYDILNGYPIFNGDLHPHKTVHIGRSSVHYPTFNRLKDEGELFVSQTIEKYRTQLIDHIIQMDVEGEFIINTMTQISNDKMVSLELYVNGEYNDSSEKIMPFKYNEYYFDNVYVNIDLKNLAEMNILDDFTIEEISQSLFEEYQNSDDKHIYKVQTKEEIAQIVESSLHGEDNMNNRFDYYYNDLSINLILYLECDDDDTFHGVESTLIRKDDLIYQSKFYKTWFGGEFQ